MINRTMNRVRIHASGAVLPVFFFLLLSFFTVAAFAGSPIAATVNGSAIKDRDIEEAIDRLIPRSTFHGSVTPEKRAEFRDKALDDLILRELQYQDATAKGLKPDRKHVKTEMEKIRKNYPSKKDYKAALEQAGYTEDSLEARFEKDSMVNLVIEKTVTEPATVGVSALKEYYDRNITKFKQPESVRLRIISAKDEKKISDILAKIKAGNDFGDVAAAMSEDNYRIKGGDIGVIHRGRIYPALEDAAFRLNKGEVSRPILTEGEWFLIKVEDKQAERQLSFDEVKDKLKRDLEKKRAAELMDRWISELRAKAKIDIRASASADKSK
ncbi:MAG: peptidylprolyl isomerase [Nitrospirota bacterium]